VNKKDMSNDSQDISSEMVANHSLEVAEDKAPSRLLIIDDDEDVRLLLKDLLEESDYEVQTAQCGEDALKMIRATTYDLVVTDLRLTGMHGLEVVKEVKAIDSGIDVIVMTGYASVNSAVESMKAGAVDYITKPFNSDQIRMVVQKNIERREYQRLAQEREFYRVLSSIDGLTELYNYRYLHQYLKMELEREKRYKRQLSLVMIDIDDFKSYNDQFGHLVGDLVLKKISAIFRNATRGCDVLCRYGGEEFAIILPETSKEEAVVVCERIRLSVEAAEMVDEQGNPVGNVSVTLGLASFPADADNKDDLIDNADRALYQGKEAGKNCIFLFGSKRKYKVPEAKTQ
jgi:diguanylate cyclase (GGDEF)-like protein